MFRKIALISLVGVLLCPTAYANSPVRDSEFTGKPSPQFDLVDLSGKKIVSGPFFAAKKATLLNFWGLRCGACLQEIPHLNALIMKYPDDLNVVGINVDGIDGSLLAEQIKKMGLDLKYSVAPDPEFKMAEIFKMTAAPLTFLIDSKGVVRYQHENYEPGDESRIEAAVKSVLGAQSAGSK